MNPKPATKAAFSKDESIQFAKGAIEILDDDNNVKKFEKNIAEIGTTAVQINEAFDCVNRGFEDMVTKYGQVFPELVDYSRQWDSYKGRWVKYLWESRDVASEMSAVLRRCNQVFLELIQTIQTDQDRKDVIKELSNFSLEKHAQSAEMAKNFKGLEADVREFGERFLSYLEQKKVELELAAIKLTADISEIQGQIKEYNASIIAGLVGMGAGLAAGLFKFIVTGITVVALIIACIQAEKELRAKQAEREEVNRKQRALAELQTKFDVLKPDIALICEKLVIFGNIWNSVSTQCSDFGAHLEKGMEALDDEEFKLQVQLARKTCTPLRNGLAKYATSIDNSPLPPPK